MGKGLLWETFNFISKKKNPASMMVLSVTLINVIHTSGLRRNISGNTFTVLTLFGMCRLCVALFLLNVIEMFSVLKTKCCFLYFSVNICTHLCNCELDCVNL